MSHFSDIEQLSNNVTRLVTFKLNYCLACRRFPAIPRRPAMRSVKTMWSWPVKKPV